MAKEKQITNFTKIGIIGNLRNSLLIYSPLFPKFRPEAIQDGQKYPALSRARLYFLIAVRMDCRKGVSFKIFRRNNIAFRSPLRM